MRINQLVVRRRKESMMEPNLIFGLLDIVSGVLIIGISIPLVKRKIKMNRFYGFRIKKTFESDDIWYDLNAYAGKLGIIWSIPILIAGIVCFFIPIHDENIVMSALVLVLVPILACSLITLIKCLAYAKKL